MRYFNWVLRALLFISLLGFALKNDQPATLRYFFGYEWTSSLVVVVLVFFAIGALLGVIAMLPNVLQQRREIARLKCDLHLARCKSHFSRAISRRCCNTFGNIAITPRSAPIAKKTSTTTTREDVHS